MVKIKLWPCKEWNNFLMKPEHQELSQTDVMQHINKTNLEKRSPKRANNTTLAQTNFLVHLRGSDKTLWDCTQKPVLQCVRVSGALRCVSAVSKVIILHYMTLVCIGSICPLLEFFNFSQLVLVLHIYQLKCTFTPIYFPEAYSLLTTK